MLYVLVAIWIDATSFNGIDARPVTGRAVTQGQCEADLKVWQNGHPSEIAACQPETYAKDML